MEYVFNTTLGVFIVITIMAFSGRCKQSSMVLMIILCLQAHPSVSKEIISLKRNGRPIQVYERKDNSRYNNIDFHKFFSSYIPPFGKILVATSEMYTTFQSISMILMKTAYQTFTKVFDELSHIVFTVILHEIPWTTIANSAIIILVLFILYRCIISHVKTQVQSHLSEFHDTMLTKIEDVKKDAQLLAETNIDKLNQLITSQNSEREKDYFDDPMFILKGIADNIRTIVSHNVRCVVHKKRKSIKSCKPTKKSKHNKGKDLEYIKNTVSNNVYAKSGDTLSTIEATYESEKVFSLKDKISQIHRRSQRISIPTYCVSNIAPQRVWIGGKWYLEDNNELKAAFSPQFLSNSPIPIKLQDSQNSSLSERNKVCNNTKNLEVKNNGKVSNMFNKDTSKGVSLLMKRSSQSSVHNSFNRKNQKASANLTYTRPHLNEDKNISAQTRRPSILQSNRNGRSPVASQSLNSLETTPQHRNWGGGDTYVRDVWSDPKEEKKRLNVTYSREDFRDRTPVSVKATVSTQTEKKRYSNVNNYAQYYYPFMYTSTPKHVTTPHNRARQPTVSEEYARYYENNFRTWWSNYYYGLQPVRL